MPFVLAQRCLCICKITRPFIEHPKKQNTRISAWRKILNYKDTIANDKDAQLIHVPARFLIF